MIIVGIFTLQESKSQERLYLFVLTTGILIFDICTRYMAVDIYDWPLQDTQHSALNRYRSLYFLGAVLYLWFTNAETFSDQDILKNLISSMTEIEARNVGISSLDQVVAQEQYLRTRKQKFFDDRESQHKSFLKSRLGIQAKRSVLLKHNITSVRETAHLWVSNMFNLIPVLGYEAIRQDDIEPWKDE